MQLRHAWRTHLPRHVLLGETEVHGFVEHLYEERANVPRGAAEPASITCDRNVATCSGRSWRTATLPRWSPTTGSCLSYVVHVVMRTRWRAMVSSHQRDASPTVVSAWNPLSQGRESGGLGGGPDMPIPGRLGRGPGPADWPADLAVGLAPRRDPDATRPVEERFRVPARGAADDRERPGDWVHDPLTARPSGAWPASFRRAAYVSLKPRLRRTLRLILPERSRTPTNPPGRLTCSGPIFLDGRERRRTRSRRWTGSRPG